MANFYLICGISGGGKTVLSKRIIELNPNIKMYDVDDYYEKVNGDECIHENFFDVWMLLWQDLHNSEINNEDILITTNALTTNQRHQFIEWFPTFKHHLIWVTAPKEKCLEGNKNRKRHVPEEKLLKGWEKMEFPNAHEHGWDTITQITNFWDEENYIIFNLKGDIEKLIKIHKDHLNKKWVYVKTISYHYKGLYDVIKYKCPDCNENEIFSIQYPNIEDDVYKYCPNCGCRLYGAEYDFLIDKDKLNNLDIQMN